MMLASECCPLLAPLSVSLTAVMEVLTSPRLHEHNGSPNDSRRNRNCSEEAERRGRPRLGCKWTKDLKQGATHIPVPQKRGNTPHFHAGGCDRSAAELCVILRFPAVDSASLRRPATVLENKADRSAAVTLGHSPDFRYRNERRGRFSREDRPSGNSLGRTTKPCPPQRIASERENSRAGACGSLENTRPNLNGTTSHPARRIEDRSRLRIVPKWLGILGPLCLCCNCARPIPATPDNGLTKLARNPLGLARPTGSPSKQGPYRSCLFVNSIGLIQPASCAARPDSAPGVLLGARFDPPPLTEGRRCRSFAPGVVRWSSGGFRDRRQRIG